jgi:hypothetical protein
MKKIIFYFFLFFVFIHPSSIFASKSELVDKLDFHQIKIRPDKSKKVDSKEKEKQLQEAKKIKKQSFEQLRAQGLIPDLIISVDSEKIKEGEIDKLISKLQTLKNEGKQIDYFTADNLKSVYIYFYKAEDKLKELKNQLLSEGIKFPPIEN